MKCIVFIYFILITSSYVIAQKASEIHVAIYFETNQHKLSTTNQKKIDSLMMVVPFDRIYLEGYADSTGNVNYNIQLSKKRAEEIVLYIATKHFYHNVEWSYKGQDQNTSKNLSNQRRVDVVFYKNPVEEHTANIIPTQPTNTLVTKDKTVKIIESTTTDPDKSNKINEILTQDKIIFNNVLFERGTDEFLHNKIPNELYYLAYALDSIKTMKIEIEGHVCCIDDMRLSEKRAKKVVQFLISQGVDKKRLSYKGYSNKQPLVKEKTPEDQQKNRRVEVIVIQR